MRIVAVVCVVIAFGCHQKAVQGTHLRLEMSAPQQAVLFIVHDEKVSYGGGLSAVENKTTWHGTMSPAQQDEFNAFVGKWRIGQQNKSIGEGVGKYNIRLREGSTDKSFELQRSDITATKVYNLLMTVADVRFNETLDALRKPSVDAMLQNRGLGENK